MNENNPDQPEQGPAANQGGFEDESTASAEAAARKKPRRTARMAVLKANFNSVFGHGIGKAALILAGLFVLIAGAFAMRGINNAPAVQYKAATVDVPNAPVPEVSVAPLDPKEAERRSQLSAMEAEAAKRQGKTYQPGFNAVIAEAPAQSGPATLNVPGQPGATPPLSLIHI